MLAASAARTWLRLSAPVAAERSARESVGPALARRYRAMNCVSHARTLAACGQLAQAGRRDGSGDRAGRGHVFVPDA
jgi:hypothetical protein